MPATKPTTYVEWRAIYQRTIFNLGLSAFHREHFARCAGTSSMKNDAERRYWKYIHRIARIEKRLSAEHEAMDDTFLESIADMLGLEDGQD